MNRIVRSACLLALTVLTAAGVRADAVQGRDYTLLPTPQTPSVADKVEVIEFFSYGCPHCYQFHPKISDWSAKLPNNAVFVRVPVSLGRREWGQLVRAYYALEATGDLARLDTALFEAIHKERKPLFNEESITAWVASQGVDAVKFRNEFNSTNVSAKASRAEQMSRSYAVNGVPQLNVAGKYLVIGRTFDDMLSIAGELVAKEGK